MKLPIYISKRIIHESLPSEISYSTYPGSKSKIIGYIVSEHKLEPAYDETYGYGVNYYYSPGGAFFSTVNLIRCAKLNKFDLKWEDIDVCE